MKILLGMQPQNTSPTLTVAYSESAYLPSGHSFVLYDQDTGKALIEDINRIPHKVKVALGQKLYMKATTSSQGNPDLTLGIYNIENSAGVTFTVIPDIFTPGTNLEFYTTEPNASFTFTYK